MGPMTYRQSALNRITRLRWNMFAMPSAKQRNMQTTPVLKKTITVSHVQKSALRKIWESESDQYPVPCLLQAGSSEACLLVELLETH